MNNIKLVHDIKVYFYNFGDEEIQEKALPDNWFYVILLNILLDFNRKRWVVDSSAHEVSVGCP